MGPSMPGSPCGRTRGRGYNPSPGRWATGGAGRTLAHLSPLLSRFSGLTHVALGTLEADNRKRSKRGEGAGRAGPPGTPRRLRGGGRVAVLGQCGQSCWPHSGDDDNATLRDPRVGSADPKTPGLHQDRARFDPDRRLSEKPPCGQRWGGSARTGLQGPASVAGLDCAHLSCHDIRSSRPGGQRRNLPSAGRGFRKPCEAHAPWNEGFNDGLYYAQAPMC